MQGRRSFTVPVCWKCPAYRLREITVAAVSPRLNYAVVKLFISSSWDTGHANDLPGILFCGSKVAYGKI